MAPARLMQPGALLLVATALLAACGGPDEPPTATVVPDSADQVLYGVHHNLTIDGVLRIGLAAETVFVYQGPQTSQLRGVRVQFFSPTGELSSTVTSIAGTYAWRTGDMEARGDVVGETPDGRRLTTEVLRYVRATQKIMGPGAFVFDSPDEHLEGDGFTADPDFQNLVVTRPARGRATDAELRRP